MNLTLTILLTLGSGLFGALLSSVLYLRYDSRRTRRDLARRLLANRHNVTGEDFTRALNEVYVVFSDYSKVVSALKEFHEVVMTRQSPLADSKLIELFKTVMRASGIDPSKVGDAFFATAFNVRK